MTENNPFLVGLVTQLIATGHTDREVITLVTDHTQPLTLARVASIRNNIGGK